MARRDGAACCAEAIDGLRIGEEALQQRVALGVRRQVLADGGRIAREHLTQARVGGGGVVDHRAASGPRRAGARVDIGGARLIQR